MFVTIVFRTVTDAGPYNSERVTVSQRGKITIYAVGGGYYPPARHVGGRFVNRPYNVIYVNVINSN